MKTEQPKKIQEPKKGGVYLHSRPLCGRGQPMILDEVSSRSHLPLLRVEFQRQQFQEPTSS